ncbi:hypothetical protein BSQ36_10630 (plasmid) [Pediococcus damnosus]|nr:hypothetical protein BSQ36_10630 [Pediococcus damnosus]
MVNTILKEADLFCPNSVRINFTIYLVSKTMLYFHKVVNSSKILEEFSLARRKEGRSDTKKVT